MLLKQRIPVLCLAVFVIAQTALLLSYASTKSHHQRAIMLSDPLTRVGLQIHGPTHESNPSGDGAFMPQSCSKSMEYAVMGQHDFEKWSQGDIDAHRKEWQDWVENTLSQPSEPGYEKFMSAVDPILSEFGYYDAATANITEGKSASGHIPLRRDRGVVVTVAERLPSAWLSTQVDFLRSYGCNLPIEVWAYEQEITAEIVQTITKLSTRQAPVFYRVVQDSRHLYRVTEERGYYIKLAAVANSAFREILYLDSDVIPFKTPEFLFDSPEFKRYGSIFWVDYWKMHPYNPAWRLFGLECVDEWEQESGMMVIDRKRAWIAIRLAAWFWRDRETTKWHQNFLLGDKDFFRLSWRATNTPAFFVPHWLTPAGLYLPLSDQFCGITMVQHDLDGNVSLLTSTS
ncbi:mannosyltransferase putative-domain-containing protein [Cladochytrium replicatum]|nr:mannosyltransferase putative-domain-containing protein [Cladochytrium replicatum]